MSTRIYNDDISVESDTKTLIIGVDGLSRSLALEMSSRGIWPNMSELVNSAQCISILSELPEVSPVNWTSMFTARGPETHGVYGFTRIDPDSYKLEITDLTCVRAETVWDRMGASGRICKIINLPGTYPAPRLRGMLVSGFVAPCLEKSVYPGALSPILQSMGYKLEANTHLGLSRPDLLLKELEATIDSRLKALNLFWPDLSWDLFMIVFTELDRVSHFLFDALKDEDHVFHYQCIEVLKKLDRAAGEILNRFADLPQPKRLLMVADHGFTSLKTEVDINAALMAGGFLQQNRSPQHEMDAACIHESSRAFALDPGRIYIHDQNRFSRGRVHHLELAGTIREIRQFLLEMRYCGEKVINRIYTREEIYPEGTALPPDLLCIPNPGFDLKAKFDRRNIFGHFGRTGMHSPEDVFFYDSLGTRPARVRDVLAWIWKDQDYGYVTP